MDDADARFEQLYREHYPRVLAYALRRTRTDEAQEVVSETFATAWRRRHELPDEPLPWLLGVARRSLANLRRARARRGALHERVLGGARTNVPPPEPADSVDPALAAAIRSLGSRDRELLALVAWDGLPPSEAAAVLGISQAGCRVRLHRIRRRLAQALDAGEHAATPPLSQLKGERR